MKTINSFRSKLFALTLALTASVASFAYEFEYVNDFHIDGFGYKIISVNTPDDGEGYVSLIEIADCKKDVVIPKYVSYGDRGFHVTTFGMGSVVFTNDASSVVESITIPKTTSVINKNALAGCPNLKTVVVDSENPYYDSRENSNAIITTSQNPYFTPNTLIAGCKTTIIPNSVAEIGDNAFYNSALESITIPTGTTKIGRSAFNNSILLSSITLSATLTAIGDWAFDDCNNLKEVICYAPQPPTISKYTFSDISPIVYVPENTVTIYQNAPYWMTFDIQPIQPSYKSQWCDTWNVLELKYRYSSYTTKEDFETWRYYLAQDTLINNYTYTAVTRQTTKVPEGVYPFTIPEPEYVAAVRFTDDRKVYIYYDNTEYLLYDFNVQLGDELTVFAGINHYHSHHTNTIRVDEVFGTEISLSVFPDFYGDERPACFGVTKWVEGVGDLCGFITGADCGLSEYQTALLCAYKDGYTEYTTEYEEYAEYGCEYNSGENKEYILTLPGLQRTTCLKNINENEVGTVWGSRSYLMQEIETATIDGKQYLLFGTNNTYDEYCSLWLREENNKILVYSAAQKKDLVLYDFTLNVGDSLPRLYVDEELSSIVDYYKYEADWEYTKPLFVTEVSTITLLDGKEYKKWTFDNGMEYVEGIGSFGTSYAWNDFYQLIANGPLYSDVFSQHLVCASKNGQLLYQMDDAEMERLGAECLCEAENPEDLFPTLWGLQRTVCNEYCGETEDDNSGNITYKQTFTSISFENNKPYILCRGYLLREESNKILLYSESLNKEIVLYDFTLAVGDSLPTYIEHFDETIYPADTLVVTDISSVTLLDGKKYKKWTFDNGMEYVEGIGMYGGHRNGNFVGLIQELVVPCHTGTHLVCVSKNGKLLYQMDDAEMERLGAECLCDYDRGPRKDNAKNGKIGGRPTPTQWNMLEVETKEMDGTPTILRAETFSYTLENDSLVAKGKTYYQLARQSTKDTAITKSFVGALHFGEDEDNRVYFLRDGHEYVLYDFTAEPGDTIEIFAGINNYPQETTYTHVVVDKDTTEDGACRMLLEVVFPDETTTATNAEKVWLAGLGSIDGIVHNAAKRTSDVHAAPSRSASSETQTSVMLCAWREDSCLYTTNHPEYDTFGCVYNQDPTAVENLTSPTSYQKIIHEGTLLILHEGKVYNVIGIQIK